MKTLLFLTAICLNFTLNAQFILELHCVDKATKENIQNADMLVQQGDSSWKRFTGTEGKIRLRLPAQIDFSVSVKHGYYDIGSAVFKVSRDIREGDTLRRVIELTKSRIKALDEHVVRAPGVPAIVFQSEKLSVSDFELLPNGEILLLAYPKRLEKGSELLIYDGLKVLQNFRLQENPKELVRDFRGNPHVVCEKGVYGIHRSEGQIGISNLEKSYFMRYIFPIVDTIQSKMFFSNFNPNYPAFDYMAFDQADSTYLKILEVKDDLMMELYRSEYKWVDVRTKLWAYNKQLETGIDKEIWVGAAYFTSSIYYKELYAPMFQRNDSVFVFDYYKDKLFTFNSFGDKIDSVEIYHHYQPKQTGWKKKLIQDQETGEVYAFFEKAGICSIRRVDLRTGKLGEKIQFQHKYIDKLALSANRAYYIYRPYESAQKKFLYVTRLPYEYGTSEVPQGNFISTDTGR